MAAERAYRASPQHAADRAYWHERMAGRPEPVRLLERGPGLVARRLGAPWRRRPGRPRGCGRRRTPARASPGCWSPPSPPISTG
ncbi:hypothetical protein ACFQ60_08175 [Streptomyces zhihengii]